MSEAMMNSPVVAGDKVSDVLARDESLVEVFVRHAAHFEKLRNRALRRVMARLVTVEQAARIANVPSDQLVRDLNEALGLGDPAGAAADSAPRRPADRVDVPSRRPEKAPTIELDVRQDLRDGREPFSNIMSAVAKLKEGDVLLLRTIFEPAPLFDVLAKRGFEHECAAYAADDWSSWFWRPERPARMDEPEAVGAAALVDVDESSLVLDVRGLEPPEPLMRTLAALESLPADMVLVQVNSRVPQLLFPMLAERGFACEVDDSRADVVTVKIWRAR